MQGSGCELDGGPGRSERAALGGAWCLDDVAAVSDAPQRVDELVVRGRLVVPGRDRDRQRAPCQRDRVTGRLQPGGKDKYLAGVKTVKHAGMADHGEIEQAVAEEIDQFHAAGHRWHDSGSGAGQSSHHIVEQALEVACNSEPDLVGDDEFLCLAPELVREAKQFAGRGQERLATCGDADAAGVAVEETHPQLGLESADSLRQRWLRHAQCAGGVAEVPGVGHRGEEA